jgi:hypothetical protein
VGVLNPQAINLRLSAVKIILLSSLYSKHLSVFVSFRVGQTTFNTAEALNKCLSEHDKSYDLTEAPYNLRFTGQQMLV